MSSLQPTQDSTEVVPQTGTSEAAHEGAKRPSPRRSNLALETHWAQCLGFPLYFSPAFFHLLFPVPVVVWLYLRWWLGSAPFSDEPDWPWYLGWLPLVLVGAYFCATLQCALESGGADAVESVRWPARNPGLVVRTMKTWIVCFLAGPVVFAVVAFLFWFHGGDLTLVDWLILAELLLFGFGWWLLQIVAVHQTGRLRDALPPGVGKVVARLGKRVVMAVL